MRCGRLPWLPQLPVHAANFLKGRIPVHWLRHGCGSVLCSKCGPGIIIYVSFFQLTIPESSLTPFVESSVPLCSSSTFDAHCLLRLFLSVHLLQKLSSDVQYHPYTQTKNHIFNPVFHLCLLLDCPLCTDESWRSMRRNSKVKNANGVAPWHYTDRTCICCKIAPHPASPGFK